MTVNRRKKNTRHRAGTTHGGGAMKKRRGAGHRGGSGMAGSGKRADQNRIGILKKYGHEYFGKHGFKRPQKVLRSVKIMNLSDLELHFDELVASKKITEDKGVFVVDLKKMGYDKILGRGHVKHKFKFVSGSVSEKAKEKVLKAGGTLLDHEPHN